MNNKKWVKLFILLVIASVVLIAATQRFDTIIAKKVIVTGSGGLELGDGSGSFDLNGKELTLDADDDSSFTADTDDQLDLELGGQDEYVFTASVLDLGEGTLTRVDLDADGDTSVRSSADDQLDLELGGQDEYVLTASVLDLGEGTLTRIDLDADGDTSVRSSADDQLDLELGGTDEITLTASQLSLNDTIIFQSLGTENLGTQPSIITQAITWTAAAGGSGTLATVTDGEIWFIHSVFIRTTTNFDATGDDVTFTIGDGNDADGFIVAADANLQTTFTEATGYAAGWYGIENGSGGAYTLDDGGPFVYAPSGADETIDWVIDETSGETITAGALTAYVIYTRIQ